MQKRRLNPPPTPLGTREPSAPTAAMEVGDDVAACVSWYLGHQEKSGKHFDPQVVEAFMAVKDKALETAEGFIARANAPFNTPSTTSKA